MLLTSLQQILYQPQNTLEIISSLGYNAFYALAVILYAIYSYQSYSYKIVDGGISIRDGLIFQKHFTIPYNKILTVTFSNELIPSALFGATKVSFDTPGGLGSKYDVTAYFSKKRTQQILDKIRAETPEQECIRADFVNTILMCAFWSNPASGFLIIAPLISSSGNVLGKELTEVIIGQTMDFRIEILARWLSPVAGAVASLLLLGWGISMLAVFLRYARFRVFTQGDYIGIARGLVNKHVMYTQRCGLTAVSIDQSLLMKILGLYTASIFTIGSGKLKGDKSLIVAPSKKKKLYQALFLIADISYRETRSVYANPRSIMSYLYLPLTVSAIIITVIATADYFIFINNVFKTLLVFSLFLLLWWILFRIWSHRKSHIGFNDRFFVVSGFSKLTQKKYYIPFRKIQRITLTQSIPQRIAGNCTVKVYLYFEKRACHTVRHLPKKEAEQLLRAMKQYR